MATNFDASGLGTSPATMAGGSATIYGEMMGVLRSHTRAKAAKASLDGPCRCVAFA